MNPPALEAPARASRRAALGRLLRYTLALALSLGLIYLAWGRVMTSPYFRLDQLVFEETPHINTPTLRRLLGLDEERCVIEGAGEPGEAVAGEPVAAATGDAPPPEGEASAPCPPGVGAHYFHFDEAEAEATLRRHSWVQRATVRRGLPDRLWVRVEEAKPAGVLILGGLFLVNAEGLPFVEAEPRDALALPIVTGLSEADFRRDQATAQARVVEALALHRLFKRHPLSRARPISNVHVAPGGRFELQLGLTRVQLGRGDFEAKFHRLDALFESLDARKLDAEYILLSDDLGRAIVRQRPQRRQLDLDTLPSKEP